MYVLLGSFMFNNYCYHNKVIQFPSIDGHGHDVFRSLVAASARQMRSITFDHSNQYKKYT